MAKHLSVLLVLTAWASAAAADTYTWNSPVYGVWPHPGQWTSQSGAGGYPNSDDLAQFITDVDYTTVFFGADVTIGDLHVWDGSVHLDLGDSGGPYDMTFYGTALRVGDLPTTYATLVVEGGTMDPPWFVVGGAAGADGTVRMRQATIEASTAVEIGPYGRGYVEMDNASFLHSLGDMVLGSQAGGDGGVDLRGQSMVTVDGDLVIGGSGEGLFWVLDGSAFDSDAPTTTAGTGVDTIGLAAGSVGRLYHAGNLSMLNHLNVGDAGQGYLDVLSGARLWTEGMTAAVQPGSSAEISLVGPTSWIHSDGNVVLGQAGMASAEVTDGAEWDCTGDLYVAPGAGSWASLRVAGYDPTDLANRSNVGVDGDFVIGRVPSGFAAFSDVTVEDHGQLDVAGQTLLNPTGRLVLDGGAVFTGDLIDNGGQLLWSTGKLVLRNTHLVISPSAPATSPFGDLLRLGAGQVMDVAELSVGQDGNGAVYVQDGGILSTPAATLGNTGLGTGGAGTVFVDGLDSRFYATQVDIGLYGPGNLWVVNGASINVDRIHVGGGAYGSLEVDGSGSYAWSDEVEVGSDDIGVVWIYDGGRANFGQLHVAATDGSGRVVVGTQSGLLDPADLVVLRDLDVGRSGTDTDGRVSVYSDATLRVWGSTRIHPTGLLALHGGTFKTGSLPAQPGVWAAHISWTQGTLVLTNSGLTLDGLFSNTPFDGDLVLDEEMHLELTSSDPSHEVVVGRLSTIHPTLEVAGGTLSSSLPMVVGKGGTNPGTFRLAGGEAELPSLTAGTLATVDLSHGRLTIRGGPLALNEPDLLLAGQSGLPMRLDLTDGASLSLDSLTVGASGGTGNVTLSGGSVFGAESLVLGDAAGGLGSFAIVDSDASVSTGAKIGRAGPGSLILQAGAYFSAPRMEVGNESTGQGEVMLIGINPSSATLHVGELYIGGSQSGPAAGQTGDVHVGGTSLVLAETLIRVWPGGRLSLAGGTVTSPALEVRGLLAGGGSVQSPETLGIGGRVDPVYVDTDAAAVLHVQGDLTMDAASEIRLLINGTDNSVAYSIDFSQIFVEGQLETDGSILLELGEMYTPQGGDIFTLIEADGLQFDWQNVSFAGSLGSGLEALAWKVAQSDGDEALVLAIAPIDPIPGDANYDGRVDQTDLAIVRDAMGQPWATEWIHGNFNSDGQVSFADFVILSNHFGQSDAVPGVLPEPATAWLLCGWGALALHRRRR